MLNRVNRSAPSQSSDSHAQNEANVAASDEKG